MNNINNNEVSNTQRNQRITNFGIEVYQEERIKNPELVYKKILYLILERIKKYCIINNFSFLEYQKFGIENKIHFGVLAKKRLSNILLSSMTVINSDVVKLLTGSYNDESCLKLIELKHGIKLDRLKNLESKNNRNNNIDEIRRNSKTGENKDTQIIGDNNKRKDKPFFINYNTINLNKLTTEEKYTIKLICKRIKTEKIDYKNNIALTLFIDTLPKEGDARDDVVHFIATQCG